MKKLPLHLATLLLLTVSAFTGCSEKNPVPQAAPAQPFDAAMIWSGRTPAPKNLALQCRRIDPVDGTAVYISAIYDSATAPRGEPASSEYRSAGGTAYENSQIVITEYNSTGKIQRQTRSHADYFYHFAGQNRLNPSEGPYVSHYISSKEDALFSFTSAHQPTVDSFISDGPERPDLPKGSDVECRRGE